MFVGLGHCQSIVMRECVDMPFDHMLGCRGQMTLVVTGLWHGGLALAMLGPESMYTHFEDCQLWSSSVMMKASFRRCNSMGRIFSGIQPSGQLGISHYVGTMQHWLRMQAEHDGMFCVVDQHAITVAQKPEALRQQVLENFALYLACGLDPEQSVIFVQSHVPAHTQLAWILTCLTGMGELSRMTQFKDKSQQHAQNINVGLYTYPVLMASDILLYGADLVPVGEDQKQHLELARDLALRFNHHYGEVLVVPEPLIAEQGARIMSLQDPSKKMSKSDPNANAFISLLDAPNVILKKVRRAVTDSQACVAYDEARPGICNLMTLYHCLSGMSVDDIALQYQGRGYGDFKQDLADLIISHLDPIQTRYQEFWADQATLMTLLQKGQHTAQSRAAPMLARVMQAIGFVTF